MQLTNIIHEDFINYHLPSLFLGTIKCNWKCCIEQNIPISICQNQELINSPHKDLSNERIFDLYASNPITQAIVIGGLEPVFQIDEIVSLISYFRSQGDYSPFVIYTGYYPDEITNELKRLKEFPNIIIKFGRYQPNNEPHYDKVLGVNLISDNQWAVQLS